MRFGGTLQATLNWAYSLGLDAHFPAGTLVSRQI